MKYITLVATFFLVGWTQAVAIRRSPEPVSIDPYIPVIDMKTPVCAVYDGQTPIVHDPKRDFPPFLYHDPKFIEKEAFITTNSGQRSVLVATMMNGYLQLQVGHSPEAPRVPYRIMVSINYNPGVTNIGQNGWWIDTGRTNTCHYWVGHSVGSMKSLNLRWEHIKH